MERRGVPWSKKTKPCRGAGPACLKQSPISLVTCSPLENGWKVWQHFRQYRKFYIAHTQKIPILHQSKGIQHRCTKKLICWILEVTWRQPWPTLCYLIKYCNKSQEHTEFSVLSHCAIFDAPLINSETCALEAKLIWESVTQDVAQSQKRATFFLSGHTLTLQPLPHAAFSCASLMEMILSCI